MEETENVMNNNRRLERDRFGYDDEIKKTACVTKLFVSLRLGL